MNLMAQLYSSNNSPWNTQQFDQVIGPNYAAIPMMDAPNPMISFNQEGMVNPVNLGNSAFNMDGTDNTAMTMPGDPNTPWYGNDALGAASAGLKGLGSLASLWMSMKNYGLQKDQLKENKRQYNQNYAAQRQSTNTQLADRQNARVASGGNYQSVGEYMTQNRIA